MSGGDAADPQPGDLLTLAAAVGIEAADLVRRRRPAGRVPVADTKSSATDPVTEIDRASEELIRGRIAQARPDDGFLGEEGDTLVGTSGIEWVVDPIDGTVNFMYGIPAYAVSIAARRGDDVLAGFVVNVADGRAWGAIRGGGAFRLDDGPRRITAPSPPPLTHLLVATGFGYDPKVRAAQGASVTRLLPQVRDIRRIGAAALDLCALAEGTVDAYVEQGLHPWDLAAGGLIATEAGCVLSGLDGPPDRRLVMGAHPEIAPEYFALVRACGF
ncbi:inositol monophosphatase family protein [Aeromicrobium sp. Leaf350]|uniref:inositol monophosphatase family protein n=1 Tax=Aeromicrobium sp. Leaf350 TaxID=2876565 RepID=UPI001E38F51C|nr:inositol monophosphatase family protein [Aeromicrobium sp. Leaf350]